MDLKGLLTAFLSVTFLIQPFATRAMETDQYNLPPTPLADIGDEVSEYVEQNLVAAVAKVNADISVHQACIDGSKASRCGPVDKERKTLEYLRSNDAVAKEVYERLGAGNIFVSHIGQWMTSHAFHASPSRYKVDYKHSIYLAAPVDYATLSPTVKLYGVEFGTDKLDHFFQQGYKYYRIYKDAAAHGMTDNGAEQKAIRWGQQTERTYFGILVSGVYSNADLYANFAGMKFYQSLAEATWIGMKTRPAMLRLRDGRWIIAGTRLRDDLLKPFISDHLNEALNPSGYAFTIFGSVHRAIRKNACGKWRQMFPDKTKADLESWSASLEKWNGEDYGFTRRSKSVPVASCFDDHPPRSSVTNASALYTFRNASRMPAE